MRAETDNLDMAAAEPVRTHTRADTDVHEPSSSPTEESRERVTAFFHALAAEPFRFDFFQAMRRLETLFADKPRFGKALRPKDEPVRLAQEPSLSFAPAALSRFS